MGAENGPEAAFRASVGNLAQRRVDPPAGPSGRVFLPGIFASLYSWRRWRKSFSLGILTLGIAIASMDEIFQYFAGGRTATWKDVCLDGVGVMAGIVMWRIGKWVFGRRPSAGDR